jgi:predicted transcriptional regulator of viral defense system
MNQVNLLNKINKFPYFTLQTVQKLLNLSNISTRIRINREVRNKNIIRIKPGLYVTKEYINSLQDKEAYFKYISNKIKYPSYISTETVLQKYGILTEAVFAITAISMKKTKTYTNDLGVFKYSKINEKLYPNGIKTKTINGFEILEATKSKALFDYLYLKLYRYSEFNSELLLSLRLNLEEVTAQEKDEFKTYCEMVGQEKFNKLTKELFDAYKAN